VRTALVFGGLLVVLVVANAAVIDREAVIANGTPVLLELAPVDPRSLIQGDYMALDYAMTRQLVDSQRYWPRTGAIVVALDERGVARFVRRHDGRTALARGEHLLTYRQKRGRIQVGTDAFHFQEGHGPSYMRARYGELRVAPSGTGVLVGLRDSAGVALRPLAP
jgi:uncharacterized membrane-anchored protein